LIWSAAFYYLYLTKSPIYEIVKNALVASHSLTPYQKVDKLMAMEPLGGRKPSKMLDSMQKLRPPNPLKGGRGPFSPPFFYKLSL
jgi:hypothetical protein